MSRRRKPSPSLPDRVRATLAARALLTPGEGVVVAVSGGPDSLALLHVLHQLSSEMSLRLVVAHLHHGMRPAVAEEDAAFVAETAASLGLRCVLDHCDVPALARDRRLSLEEAGREARYALLGRVAAECGFERIATGHTADDRVETVLLNLIRGTGIDGLAGIPARRPLAPGSAIPEVVRPLIDCWRRDVLDYCAAAGLTPRWDATNESRDHARNRVRHELIPWLEREMAPVVKRRLLRLAEMAEEEGAFMRDLARQVCDQAAVERTPDQIHLQAASLAAAPAPLARRALREALRGLGIVPGSVDWEAIDDLLQLARGDRRTGITLAEVGVTGSRAGDALVLTKPAPPSGREPSAVVRPLQIPGVTDLPELGFRLETRVVPKPASPITDASQEAYLDLHRLHLPLIVRAPRPGDRMTPLGMSGTRKLQDILVERKVPRELRARVPVVADAKRIVWVVGCCIGEEVKVRPETERVVQVTVSRPCPPAEQVSGRQGE